MKTAYERYQYNLQHAGDAGSLYTEENKGHAWMQYQVERLLEAADIPLDDNRDMQEDFDLIFHWINVVNQ